VRADDHDLARELALEAGRRLIELRARGGEPDLLRKAGDRLSHEFLTAELAARRPGDAVLSEEGADDPARLAASRVWIVDPLDGTSEFGEPGRTDWAVHVALWERRDVSDSGDLAVGTVALPAQDKVLSTALRPSAGPHGCHNHGALAATLSQPCGKGGPQTSAGPGDVVAEGTFETDGPGGAPQQGERGPRTEGPGGAPQQGERGPRVRIVVSRSRAPRLVYGISDLIGAELVPLGSAGAKVAAVVYGEADAYVHAGGFYEWDTAAPVAVARAAGFHASRIDGAPLAYNQANVRMPDILVCRPALAGALLQAIREIKEI
jgi:3'(2'), 5'-bisphosphate nucleotidase